MLPIAPFLAARDHAPNVELLRRHGWSVNCITGSYCVAWRGRDEVLLQWQEGSWQRVGGRGGFEDV